MVHRIKTPTIFAATTADAKAWAKQLGCSVAELRIALRAVGSSVDRVKAYLHALNGRAPRPSAEGSAPSQESGEGSPTPTRVWPWTSVLTEGHSSER
jgi:hypothetical protein